MNKPNSAGPCHVAVIMDGNRRWAELRHLSASAGHAWGARQVRSIVEACIARNIRFLTVFVFSTENWSRPAQEVSSLLRLFSLYLKKELKDLNANGVQLKVVGDVSRFSSSTQKLISHAQSTTAHNTQITLTLAANYGGRWDVLQAFRAWQLAYPGQLLECMDESSLSSYLAMSHAPDPDLLIRTGGEMRISNFMLWQTAYTELFFTDVLWPSFGIEELDRALEWFSLRERRFGGTSTRMLSPA